MVPEAGQKFGPYEILGELGGGGMGMVFRAFDPRLHREVALKLLHDQFSMPTMRERFLREARAASALNHPNICTVFDLGEQNGEPYMVMELMNGETLRDRIARGKMPSEEIIHYCVQVADALSEAHSKGIVHRDIKPANIFLVRKSTGVPQVKVLDFGLAKMENSSGSGHRDIQLTSTGATVGTVAYMSPEQARGESLDARTDIFSCGAMMYEMATGHLPFTGATSAVVFAALLGRDPDPVRNWNAAIPKELEKIILKALMKDPRQRFQRADELQAALEKASGKQGHGGWLGRAFQGGSDDEPRHDSPMPRGGSDPVRDRTVVQRKSPSAPMPDVSRLNPSPPPSAGAQFSTDNRNKTVALASDPSGSAVAPHIPNLPMRGSSDATQIFPTRPASAEGLSAHTEVRHTEVRRTESADEQFLAPAKMTPLPPKELQYGDSSKRQALPTQHTQWLPAVSEEEIAHESVDAEPVAPKKSGAFKYVLLLIILIAAPAGIYYWKNGNLSGNAATPTVKTVNVAQELAAGNYSKALQVAGPAYESDPHNGEAYGQAEIALLGLDRYEAAAHLEGDSQKNGSRHDANLVAALYLSGKDPKQVQPQDADTEATYAFTLDDSGQFVAGVAAWQVAAQMAQAQGLNVQAGSYLAQQALDYSLSGQCGPVSNLVSSALNADSTPHTQMMAAVAAAMCGNVAQASSLADSLRNNESQDAMIEPLYLPEVMGVIALKSGDTQKALTSFDSARKYDLISLTAYLRGLAHIEAKQGQLAIGDFQGVLEHRGAAFVSRNPIYALAQAGLGRAFASIGDKGNSAKAYQSFLDDWSNADAGQPLIIEAKAHIK